jgi:hypothetical protein
MFSVANAIRKQRLIAENWVNSRRPVHIVT